MLVNVTRKTRKSREALVLQLARQLTDIHDLDLLLEKILNNARIGTHADAGSIYVKTEGNALSVCQSQNETKQKELAVGEKLVCSSFVIPINQNTISGYVAETGKMLNIPDMYHLSPDLPYRYCTDYDQRTQYKSVSSLTVPLKNESQAVIGVLQLINAKNSKGKVIPFSPELELYVEIFASIAATALERAQLTRSLVDRMINLAALRDPKETALHANRVASYSVELYEKWAKKHQVEQKEIDKTRDILRIAAMLHDIGKVGISDLILKKPGLLTDDERKEMEGHCYTGYKAFGIPITDHDLMAREIALRHHENWDGSGYPGHIDLETGENLYGKRVGLKGEEIPFLARVVSLCDVYDALSSDRSYKKGWDEATVIDELNRLRGIKFDPELVDILIEMRPILKAIRVRYSGEAAAC